MVYSADDDVDSMQINVKTPPPLLLLLLH